MGLPYLFFDFVPTEMYQIKRGIKPIIVIAISIHQPDLPTSCNLLAVTDNEVPRDPWFERYLCILNQKSPQQMSR